MTMENKASVKEPKKDTSRTNIFGTLEHLEHSLAAFLAVSVLNR